MDSTLENKIGSALAATGFASHMSDAKEGLSYMHEQVGKLRTIRDPWRDIEKFYKMHFELVSFLQSIGFNEFRTDELTRIYERVMGNVSDAQEKIQAKTAERSAIKDEGKRIDAQKRDLEKRVLDSNNYLSAKAVECNTLNTRIVEVDARLARPDKLYETDSEVKDREALKAVLGRLDEIRRRMSKYKNLLTLKNNELVHQNDTELFFDEADLKREVIFARGEARGLSNVIKLQKILEAKYKDRSGDYDQKADQLSSVYARYQHKDDPGVWDRVKLLHPFWHALVEEVSFSWWELRRFSRKPDFGEITTSMVSAIGEILSGDTKPIDRIVRKMKEYKTKDYLTSFDDIRHFVNNFWSEFNNKQNTQGEYYSHLIDPTLDKLKGLSINLLYQLYVKTLDEESEGFANVCEDIDALRKLYETKIQQLTTEEERICIDMRSVPMMSRRAYVAKARARDSSLIDDMRRTHKSMYNEWVRLKKDHNDLENYYAATRVQSDTRRAELIHADDACYHQLNDCIRAEENARHHEWVRDLQPQYNTAAYLAKLVDLSTQLEVLQSDTRHRTTRLLTSPSNGK